MKLLVQTLYFCFIMMYQFKIQIEGIVKPPVWRRLIVPADFTFYDFHEVIQLAFGWENCHLFSFRDKKHGASFSIELEGEDGFLSFFNRQTIMLAETTVLKDIVVSEGQVLFYTYDFGDDWIHKITVEKIIEVSAQKKASCIGGKSACPPEDCGGIYGFDQMKYVFQNEPKSKQAKEYREWLCLDKGELFDFDFFDLDFTNKKLGAY